MKIAVDFGHNTKYDGGAVGILNEEAVVREYGSLVISKLQALGNDVLNVTPSSATSLSNSLAQRVIASNNFGADLFVSCHVNSFGDSKANGCEVEYVSEKGREYAERVCTAIADLGFTNRHPNYRTGLYVLNHTKAVAILIEPFFCSNPDDCIRYYAEEIATAIVKGITGQIATKPVVAPEPEKQEGNDWVRRLQQECNAQGFSSQTVDGYPGPHTLNGCPTCKIGARGNITKLLQEKLSSLRYDTNGVDGIYGNGTYKAVASFQRDKRLDSDGICGKNTWLKLLGL